MFNVVLVSGIQQKQSVGHILISTVLDSHHIGVKAEYRIELPVLYSRTLLFIHRIYTSLNRSFQCHSEKLSVPGLLLTHLKMKVITLIQDIFCLSCTPACYGGPVRLVECPLCKRHSAGGRYKCKL